MKRTLSCTSIASGLLLLVACGCQDSGPETAASTAPRPGGTAVIGVIADIQTWNPYLAETAFTEDLLSLIYPALATELTDYAEHPPGFAPSLARSWELSTDQRVLTFHLHERARWSDGAPVTADDVVFTWRTQMAEELGWTGVFVKDAITAVEAVDAHTVRFVFDRVYPYQLMDANEGLIVPAHAWGRIPYSQWQDTNWQPHVLAAGPFRLASHTPQQEIVLEANPTYWVEGRPLLSRVVWRIVPSQSSLLTQLRSGALDFVNTVRPLEIDSVSASSRTAVTVFPDRSYTFAGWNTSRDLFADVRTRRALSMAIDRQEILDAVRRGYGRLAVGPVLSTMWAFNRGLAPPPFDPAQAADLLAAAGWSDIDGDGTLDRGGRSFEFDLLANSGNQERADVCVLISEDLARIGVRATPRLLEWGALVARQNGGDFDAIVSTWREPTQVDLEDVWHSAPEGQPTSNFVRYTNPEVDSLLARVNQTPDFEDQRPLLARIQEIIVAEQPYTFLYERDSIAGISRRIGGAQINDATPYFNLEEWFIQNPR